MVFVIVPNVGNKVADHESAKEQISRHEKRIDLMIRLSCDNILTSQIKHSHQKCQEKEDHFYDIVENYHRLLFELKVKLLLISS